MFYIIKMSDKIVAEASKDENTSYDDPKILEYLGTLDEKEIIALNVARQQLGQSLDINLSNGFIEYKKSH
jgi:hypothetical protein